MKMALHEFNYEKEKVINIVKKILEDAILIFATDIHFDPQEDELIIRLRIDGDLVLYTTVPESAMKNIITRIKILAGMNITESSISQTGFITYKMKDEVHNMRVSSIPVVHGEKIVVHISNHANKFAKLQDLNFSDYDYRKIKNLLNNTAGTILIAGSTTSGKATTMYAMIHELDHNKKNIFTIENRIKANIDGVNQIQVDKHKGLTPNNILKTVLLSDPNVIVLSEINDIETANNILKASVTGRLVISTIHSKNIYTTIDTLINMDIENYLLSSSLTGIISQRLVKRLCPKCRRKRKTTDLEKEIFTNTINKNIKEIYEPVGCDNCINGYQGQIPISEVVEINDTIRNAITNPREKANLRNLVYEHNTTIFEDGLVKVINGDTSLDEVIRVIDLNSDFAKDEEVIKKLILDEINDNDIDENNDNVNVPVRSLIPDKIAIEDIVIEEKDNNNNKEDKLDKNKKNEDHNVNSKIDKNDEDDTTSSDSSDFKTKNKNTSKKNIDVNIEEDNNEDDGNSDTSDIDNDIDDEKVTEQDDEDIKNSEIDNKNESTDDIITNDDEDQEDSEIDVDVEEGNNNHGESDSEIDIDTDEDTDEDNNNHDEDEEKIIKKLLNDSAFLTSEEQEEDKNLNKKKQNKKKQNKIDDEDDEKNIEYVEDKEEHDEDNNAKEEVEEDNIANKETVNNLLDNYIIDENGILVAKDIINKQEDLKKENESLDKKDDNNNDIASEERVNNILDNYVIDENGILVAKSILENQQSNNKEDNLNNDSKLNENKEIKHVNDRNTSLDSASLSITDEDVKRIKEAIDYDDFSYDDSYKNDF